MNYGNVLEISLYRENDVSFFSMDFFFYCFLFYRKSFLFLFVKAPVLTHFLLWVLFLNCALMEFLLYSGNHCHFVQSYQWVKSVWEVVLQK